MGGNPLAVARGVTGGRGQSVGAGPQGCFRPGKVGCKREAEAALLQCWEDGAAGDGTGAEERRVAE